VRVHELTAWELTRRMAAGEVSAREVTDAFLERLGACEPRLGAFLYVNEESARAQAEDVDRRRARGEALGALAGVPVALKDNLCTRDMPTTCASRILADFRPPYDADVVERLRAADAVLLGKTNLDEFAMGSSTENSAFGPTRNPWDPDRVPGGSSGGSAAAVAARMCSLALGSDTGGSVRQPAAFCGVVGLKPTYGRVSRYGLVAFASSLDQIGPFAADARDAALLAGVVCGHDPRDSTSVNHPAPDFVAALEGDLRGLRIGVPDEYFGDGLDGEIAAAVQRALRECERLGAETRPVSLPHTDYAVAAYYLVAPAEASSNLARYDGAHYGHRSAAGEDIVEMFSRSRSEGFGPEVRRRILLGTYALSAGYYDAYYLKAAKVRRLIQQDFDRAFERVDCLMGPVAPVHPFRIGEKVDDPLAMYLADVYTIPVNLAGLPGLSVCCGFSSDGLPVGLQIIGPAFSEDRLLRVAWAYQQATDFHRRIPPVP